MKGIEKEVDRLGRVVIPSEYRKRLGIKEGSKIVFSSLDRGIYLETVDGGRALCSKKLRKEASARLCEVCLADIAKRCASEKCYHR